MAIPEHLPCAGPPRAKPEVTDDGVPDTIVQAQAARTSPIAITAPIVTAFVEHDDIETGALSNLIAAVHRTLAGFGASATHPAVALPLAP